MTRLAITEMRLACDTEHEADVGGGAVVGGAFGAAVVGFIVGGKVSVVGGGGAAIGAAVLSPGQVVASRKVPCALE